MSGIQPITIEESDHYLATRQITRVPTRKPARLKTKKLSGPAVQRTLATFGKPDDDPAFKFPIGSRVSTVNGTTVWTVLSQAETPAGTSPRSYRCSAGQMERIFGENALKAYEPAPVPTKKLKIVDVALNRKTGQIEPVDPFKRIRASEEASRLGTTPEKYAKSEVRKMLEASIAPQLTPSIDDPALFTVEPMTPKFETITTYKRTGKATSSAPKAAGSSTTVRLNAVFKPDQRVTVLVTKSPKNPDKKNFTWFQKVWDEVKAGRDTIASIVASDRSMPLMAEIKHAVQHGWMSVA